MSVFWRNLFTSHHDRRASPAPLATPATHPPTTRKKQHARSSSSPVPLATGTTATQHIYDPTSSSSASRPGHSILSGPGTQSRTHNRPDRKRSSSCAAPAHSSSPVRFAASARVSDEQGYAASARPPYMRSGSHASASSSNIPYAIYAPSTSYSSSSRTASATSVRMPPRTDSSSSVPRHSFEMRPPLKQHHTWHGDDAQCGDKGKRSNIHSVPMEITPLMVASGRSKKSYIEYDVTFLPSARSVTNRHTKASFPEQTLLQPATRQPTTSKLTLRSHKLPWNITVSPIPQAPPPAKPTFYIGSSSTVSAQQLGPITILDVLQSIHQSLSTPVTQQEWAALGAGSKVQKKVTKAYRARCSKMGGGWESGVRRIDWLGPKTKFVGLEVDSSLPDGRTYKLLFSRA